MEIRVATIQDAQEIRDIYAPYVINTNITFEYDVPSIEEMVSRIDNTLKKYPYLVAIEKGKIIGYAYASTFKGRRAYDWTCELSIYIEESLHGKGVGKALYTKLIEILKMMNMQTVYACITHPNEKSEAFHEMFGFKQCALFKKSGYKFNEWHDMIWMDKVIGNQEDVKNVILFPEIM